MAAVGQVAFDFRVRYGFKLLLHGLCEEGVAEFHKAVALTNEPKMRLRIYAQIGTALRSSGMRAPARAAYVQAASCTEDPVILRHLERNIAEMMGSDGGGAAYLQTDPEKEK